MKKEKEIPKTIERQILKRLADWEILTYWNRGLKEEMEAPMGERLKKCIEITREEISRIVEEIEDDYEPLLGQFPIDFWEELKGRIKHQKQFKGVRK